MDAPVITIPRLARIPWLVHGFGTCRFSLSDLRRLAARHRAAVILLDQVHSAVVRAVAAAPAGKLSGDALATRTPGLVLAVRTADCLPILLVDEKRRTVAAVHAGWRGLAQGIAGRAAAALRDRFGSDPADLIAALGPSIGPSCYEVGEDVRRRFAQAGFSGRLFVPIRGRPGKYLFDLAAAGAAELRTDGLRPGRIFRVGRCTHCDPAFHSFRRDRDARRRLYNFIGILE